MALRIGIVGSGMIAGATASAIRAAEGAQLTLVASRRPSRARAFADEWGIEAADDWRSLIASDAVDAVYIATPTKVREQIAIATADAGKHVLAEKPFESAASVGRILAACRTNRVAFLDCTHFSHHPRTERVRRAAARDLGLLLAAQATFFVPVLDRSNIRYDPSQEPLGVLGDLAWYCLRAFAEFLPGEPEAEAVHAVAHRDTETGAILRISGVIGFDSGVLASFASGFDANVWSSDVSLIGAEGELMLDDYVHDWDRPFFEGGGGRLVGYSIRRGVSGPTAYERFDAPCPTEPASEMIQTLTRLAREPSGDEAQAHASRTLRTQSLVDRVLASLG